MLVWMGASWARGCRRRQKRQRLDVAAADEQHLGRGGNQGCWEWKRVQMPHRRMGVADEADREIAKRRSVSSRPLKARGVDRRAGKSGLGYCCDVIICWATSTGGRRGPVWRRRTLT